MYQEVDGDLIFLAKQGAFDVIAHGCNCFCTQKAGIAPQMVRAFGTDEFPLEDPVVWRDINGNKIQGYKGDINKLGQIDYKRIVLDARESPQKAFLYVVNAYTQYNYGANHADGDKKPVDYEAITLVMRKINRTFTGKHIGLPKIGAGLAGGDWNTIKSIIQTELKDCNVTVVNYKA